MARTLRSLSEQVDRDFEFRIWNNNPAISKLIATNIKKASPNFPVTVHESDTNIGEIGLLHLGAAAFRRGVKRVVTIDDDEELHGRALEYFRREALPETISSFWAWRFLPGGGYYERARARRGESAHYCGFGGTVFDAELFSHQGLFRPRGNVWRGPGGRVVLTDLWVSFYASHVLGWKLKGSMAHLEIFKDGKDQSIGLFERKKVALSHLRDNLGWKF
jgi:hypothetical protein